MSCIVCQEPLTEDTDSEEHVFSNAIGGILTVRDFICRNCNSRAGQTWDAELARQMHALCVIFRVVRERGETPALKTVTTAGEELTILADGTLRLTDPEFQSARTEGGTEIRVVARDMREARGMLEGLKRKFPRLDVEALLESAEMKTSYPEGLFKHDFSFGGEQAGRSMVKTAAAFARHLGISTTACDLATAYLRGENAEAPFGYYWAADLVINRRVGVPFHCVAISADPASGLLLGYVEYFGAVRIVACLSQTYTGKRIHGSYAINPTTGEVFDVSVSLQFNRADLEGIFGYTYASSEGYKAAMDAVLGPAMAQSQVEARRRAIAEAAKYAFANCGAEEGAALTAEHKERLVALFLERVMPYVLHMMPGSPSSEALSRIRQTAGSAEERE
jgi:HNH endonuclease